MNCPLHVYIKRCCIWCVVSLQTFVLIGQESLGLNLDKYSGVNLIDLNPAASSKSPYKWDFLLGSAHGFAFTDYGHLRKSSLLNLAGNLNDAFVVEAQGTIPDPPTATPLIIFDEDGGDKKISTHIEVWGPGAMFNVLPGLKIGVFTKAKANISSFNMPETLGFYELNEARYVNFQLELEPAKLSGMYWQEIGVHASQQLGPLSFGFNMKYLIGGEGFFIENNAFVSYPFDEVELNPSGLPIDLQFGFTNNTLNNESFAPFSGLNSGVGLGFDLGVTYAREGLQLGASILDIGRVSFTQGTEIYRLDTQSTAVELANYDSVGSARDFLNQVQADFNVELDEVSDFKIGLPMALSLQGDLHLQDNYYVSATLTNRIKLFPNSLSRDNTLSIIPRYESKWISAFLPITVYEYSRVRVGAAARFGFLTIGSDHIMSVFTNSDFRGSDIYVRLAFFPFGDQSERSVKGRGKSKGSSELGCFEF